MQKNTFANEDQCPKKYIGMAMMFFLVPQISLTLGQ